MAQGEPFDTALSRNYAGRFVDVATLDKEFYPYASKDAVDSGLAPVESTLPGLSVRPYAVGALICCHSAPRANTISLRVAVSEPEHRAYRSVHRRCSRVRLRLPMTFPFARNTGNNSPTMQSVLPAEKRWLFVQSNGAMARRKILSSTTAA